MPEIPSVYWTDRQGVIQKTLVSLPGFQQVTYRTDRETALRDDPASVAFDLGARTMVPVERGLEQPHATSQIDYRAALSGRNPASVFVDDGSQTIEPIDERSALIHVKAIRPGGEPPARTTAPLPADREPNSLIQSNHPAVKALAESVAPAETDSWQLACALERLVYQHVDSQQFSHALASAAEVATSGTGDCTEHAVLLAAVCRARGLPARVAIGLVYFDQAQAFAYHMWNEVWIDDRWIPLDATLGRGGIGAAHLKITTSGLEGATPHTALLPVLELLGSLSLSIERVQ
jgi:transglutaminase-like putative cysteine protease